jgi:predicted naringenin-chalcone synthase
MPTGLVIRGIGTALPPYTMAQADAAQASKTFSCQNDRQGRVLDTIFQRSDVARRASVILEKPNGLPIRQSFFPPALDEQDRGPTTLERMEAYASAVPVMAYEASNKALDESGIAAEEITHLVTVSCTGFIAPGFDIALIKQLGLSPTVQRTHVGFMGCHGAINGLRVAAAMAASQPGANVLLCAVELCSLHFYYGWDVEKVKANALFSDGAAAVVATGGAEEESWRVMATGSCLFPDSEEAMTWKIGNHGFEMTLSAEVPDLIHAHLRPWLMKWFGDCGLSFDDIGSWAVHPGGPRIVSSVAACLGLDESCTATSRRILAECGNMSSPTILFILEQLRRERAMLPCVALGFGPGLVAEAALLV